METPLIPLTQAQEDIILGSISYSRSKLAEDLASLKLWTSQQQHFPPSAHEEPDAFFHNYLVGCKGDMMRARAKIDNYYRFRSRAKDICADRDPMDRRSVDMWPYFQVLTLPKSTPEGSRIFLSVTGIPDYKDYNPLYIVKRITCILDMMMRTEPIQDGMFIVLNSANFSTSYVLSVLKPTFIRNVVHYLQNVMPFRIKGIISINTPSYCQVAINRIVKPMMKQKMAKRVNVYTEGFEVLTKHFSVDVLPNDYGGQDDPLQTISDKWMECASSSHWRQWLLTSGVETVQETPDSARGLLNSLWG